MKQKRMNKNTKQSLIWSDSLPVLKHSSNDVESYDNGLGGI